MKKDRLLDLLEQVKDVEVFRRLMKNVFEKVINTKTLEEQRKLVNVLKEYDYDGNVCKVH